MGCLSPRPHTHTSTHTDRRAVLCFLREIYERRRLVRFKLNSIFCAARADAASAALAASDVLLQHATWVWGSNNNKLLNNKVFCCYSLLTVAFYGAAHFIRFSSLRFASFYFACFLFSPSRPFFSSCAFSLKIDFPFTSFNVEKGKGKQGSVSGSPRGVKGDDVVVVEWPLPNGQLSRSLCCCSSCCCCWSCCLSTSTSYSCCYCLTCCCRLRCLNAIKIVQTCKERRRERIEKSTKISYCSIVCCIGGKETERLNNLIGFKLPTGKIFKRNGGAWQVNRLMGRENLLKCKIFS